VLKTNIYLWLGEASLRSRKSYLITVVGGSHGDV
jgi:hypothetical protein